MNDDPLIELLEDAFGAGFDHATYKIWGWDKAFKDFLRDYCDEIKVVRETL